MSTIRIYVQGDGADSVVLPSGEDIRITARDLYQLLNNNKCVDYLTKWCDKIREAFKTADTVKIIRVGGVDDPKLLAVCQASEFHMKCDHGVEYWCGNRLVFKPSVLFC